jgi:NDP-mannose synthase
MKAIVLAGGRGKRLRPHTDEIPKPLMPIGGMPVLEILLRRLNEFGVNGVILCISYKAEDICNYFRDGRWLGLDISYSKTDQPLGTAGPLVAVPRPAASCLVLNADILTDLDFADLIDEHRRAGPIVTMVAHESLLPLDYGVVTCDDSNSVVTLDEKPTLPVLVNAGIYIVEPELWDNFGAPAFLDMPTLLKEVLASGSLVNAYRHSGVWIDIGNHAQYQYACEQFLADPKRFLSTDRRQLLEGVDCHQR